MEGGGSEVAEGLEATTGATVFKEGILDVVATTGCDFESRFFWVFGGGKAARALAAVVEVGVDCLMEAGDSVSPAEYLWGNCYHPKRSESRQREPKRRRR